MLTTEASLPLLVSGGEELDQAHVGPLRDSSDIAGDPAALRHRMDEEGYLFLPGYLDRDEVVAVRREMIQQLDSAGFVRPGTDPMEAVASSKEGLDPDLFDRRRPGMMKLLYGGRMMAFYEGFLGGAVRHFDYTWLRIMPRGRGTQPHCDIVYMGRGTHELYTSWTPLGDISYEIGGLMILEGTSRNQRLRQGIKDKDVDTYCTNRPGRSGLSGWNREGAGWFKAAPTKVRRSFGGRWLSTEYRMGDLMVFGMFTVHGSLDNRSDRIRLSTDTRYQRADQPVDERWIGENPIGHGAAGKRGKIC